MIQKRLEIWVLIGGLLLIPCHPAMGQCAIVNMLKGDFGGPTVRQPWFAEGKISVHGTAISDRTTGWNALRQSVSLAAKTGYALIASVRTSRNMRDGYLGFRGKGLAKPVEMKFGPKFGTENNFSTVRATFTPVQAGTYDVFVGFWALEKDSWIEVHDVRLETLSGGCNDVTTKPDH